MNDIFHKMENIDKKFNTMGIKLIPLIVTFMRSVFSCVCTQRVKINASIVTLTCTFIYDSSSENV